jgi:hypothetical protein
MDLISHIKAGGQVQTRDGQPVTIYTTEHTQDWPIVGKIDGDDAVDTWKSDGCLYADNDGSKYNLVPVPRKLSHDITVAFYVGGCLTCRRENEAGLTATKGLIAIKRLTVEATEGEGL